MAGIGFFNNNNKALLKNAYKINKLDNQYKKNKELLQKAAEPDVFFTVLQESYGICETMREMSLEINLFIGVDASEKMLEELNQNRTEWLQVMMNRAVAQKGNDAVFQLAEPFMDVMTEAEQEILQEFRK